MNIKAELSKEDIAKFTAGFAGAMNADIPGALEHLGDVAVQSLSELDRRLDHPSLAGMWKHEGVVETESGYELTVFSEAENIIFPGHTGGADDRHRTDQYKIEGNRLLAILEGGAARHDIVPHGDYMLRFPDSVSEGRTIFSQHVDHPGVQANHNLEATRDLIEGGLDAAGTALAEQISADLVP